MEIGVVKNTLILALKSFALEDPVQLPVGVAEQEAASVLITIKDEAQTVVWADVTLITLSVRIAINSNPIFLK
jgi:hypothetical protein